MVSPFYPSIQFVPSSRAYDQGKFGRLFPALPPWQPDMDITEAHQQLAEAMFRNLANANDHLPSGYTYLGQFIVHDISFDPTAIGERQVDPEFLRNFRTPSLDLDSIYGGGPYVNPYLYRNKYDDWRRVQFQIGRAEIVLKNKLTNIHDLPRIGQSQDGGNTAVIPDIRNDEHLLISQLHTAFLLFHNKVVTALKDEIDNPNLLFQQAQRIVRWHFQWIILKEYLPKIIGQNAIDAIFENGRKYFIWRHEPFIPTEFSGAVFRFGHSQVRKSYRFNESTSNTSLLQAYNGPNTLVEWSRFFPENGDDQLAKINKAPLIGPHLSAGLKKLPKHAFPAHRRGEAASNLALRNLNRGQQLCLPSGQVLAEAMQMPSLPVGDDLPGFPVKLRENTPLWFYVLYEAEKMCDGKQLGPLGSIVVAEVIIGLLQGDKTSFLNQAPSWKPTLGQNNDFTMADLLKFAGVYEGAIV